VQLGNDKSMTAGTDPTHQQCRDGLTDISNHNLTSLAKTGMPALLLGALVLAAWAVVAPFVTALAWAVMIA
jgi:hypothetical protein